MVHPCSITYDSPSQKSLSFSRHCYTYRMHVSTCTRLCLSFSCWGNRLLQILWYSGSSWIMECAAPQLMSSLSAVWVTLIRLSSWTNALTRSTLFAVPEVVRRPERSSSATLVLSVWNIPPTVHLPLSNTFLSVLWYHCTLNIGGFYPIWPHKSNDITFVNISTIRKRIRQFHTMIIRDLLNITVTPHA